MDTEQTYHGGTLRSKNAPGYTTDEGQVIPVHTLYRFEDADGKGGCWYSTLDRARTSWDRLSQGR